MEGGGVRRESKWATLMAAVAGSDPPSFTSCGWETGGVMAMVDGSLSLGMVGGSALRNGRDMMGRF